MNNFLALSILAAIFFLCFPTALAAEQRVQKTEMATLFLYVLAQLLRPLPVCGTAQQQRRRRRRVCDALFCTSQATTTFSMRNVPQKHILCEKCEKTQAQGELTIQKGTKMPRKTAFLFSL